MSAGGFFTFTAIIKNMKQQLKRLVFFPFLIQPSGKAGPSTSQVYGSQHQLSFPGSAAPEQSLLDLTIADWVPLPVDGKS